MHIPDGYLSLQTALPAAGVMVPFWKVALDRVKKTVGHKHIPLLALCAAYSFVIMMFNVPLGESSVHAVGAVFIALLMGPWAACLAVSTALIIQAFIFGDGGILALGANCFNMAVVMPFVGYGVYRLIAGRDSSLGRRRRAVAVFLGAYAGLNAAALCTAIEFGIQPLLFKSAAGVPLYGYFPLSVAVPVMMFEHMIFAGPIEGLITVGALSYVEKWAPHLLPENRQADHRTSHVETVKKPFKALILALGVMILATPLGLLATGTAWGEWGAEELQEKIGFVPQGFLKFSEIWNAWMPDYSIASLGSDFLGTSLGYVTSAVVGIAIIFALMFFSARLMVRPKDDVRE